MNRLLIYIIPFLLIANISLSKDLYWVNGEGNWNNPNHWSNISGGKSGKRYITFVGPPVPAKNPEKFLEIIRYSNDNDLNFKFLLITRFPLDDTRFHREENLRVFSKPRISDEEFGDFVTLYK